MNGEEHKVLQEIKNDIKETIKSLQDEVIKSRDEVQNIKTEFAETRADVKNLVNYVDNINGRIEHWTQHGCPHGQVNATKIEAVDEKIGDTKKDIDELKNDLKNINTSSTGITKKQASGLIAAITILVTAIANAIASVLK